MLPLSLLSGLIPLVVQLVSNNEEQVNEGTSLLFCTLLQYIVVNLETQRIIRQQRRLRYLRYTEEQREISEMLFLVNASQDSRRAKRKLWRKKKSIHWWTTIVPLYSDQEFVENFRTANQFGCAKSTACMVYHQVCEAIEEVLMPKFITFPTGQELKKNIEKFKMKGGFPQIVGAIDGTHIAIIAPRDQAQDYFNRKDYYSILLQGVVDSNGMFIDTFCGMPGSVNDARMFHISNFGESLKNGNLFNPYKEENINGVKVPPLIVGDGAYPLLCNLMRPFPNRARYRDREKSRFNYKLSQCRVIVEHAFGRLKGRWRILLKRNEHEFHKLRSVVQACCTLHNICTSNGVPYQKKWTDEEVRASLSQQPSSVNTNVGPRAEQIRSAIIAELMKIE